MQNDIGLDKAVTQLDRVRKEIGKIIVGQQDIVDGVLICLMAAGTSCSKAFRAWAKPPSSGHSAASCISATRASSSPPT